MPLLDRLFARFYDRLLEPSEVRGLADARRDLLADLDGTVVEIGAGTGLNLAHIPAAVTRWVACEPEPAMASQLRDRAAGDARVEVIEAPAQALPLDDASVDHVVATLVLCTVDDLAASVREVTRVLRPGGSLRLIEHIGAEAGRTATAQRIVEPAWKVVARGCHLTRDPRDVLADHGFDVSGIEDFRIPGSVSLNERGVWGSAIRAA